MTPRPIPKRPSRSYGNDLPSGHEALDEPFNAFPWWFLRVTCERCGQPEMIIRRLDDGFCRSLREHPVPVREEAVRAIGARSLALDVYIWLAYWLHALTRSTPVTWTSLHAQFGAGFKAVRQLKPTFRDALMLALAVYPEARVDVEATGVVLHPSAPAVPRAEAKRIGLG